MCITFAKRCILHVPVAVAHNTQASWLLMSCALLVARCTFTFHMMHVAFCTLPNVEYAQTSASCKSGVLLVFLIASCHFPPLLASSFYLFLFFIMVIEQKHTNTYTHARTHATPHITKTCIIKIHKCKERKGKNCAPCSMFEAT
jgi:hypothetical protein